MSLPHHIQQPIKQTMSSEKFSSSQRPPSEPQPQQQQQQSSLQHGINSAYPPYSSSATPPTSFYRQDALDPLHHQTYLQSIAHNKTHPHPSVTCSNSEQKEHPRNEDFNAIRSEESTFAHLTPALKHLTDSLSLEQQPYQIPHPRQHLHQFLQQQNQHRIQQHNLLHQQSALTNHMLSALHHNGNRQGEVYAHPKILQEAQQDRNSPHAKPYEQVMKSVADHDMIRGRASISPKGSWPDSCGSNKSVDLSSPHNSDTNMLSQNYSNSSPVSFSNNSPNNLVTSDNRRTDDGVNLNMAHNLKNKKHVTASNFNVMEEGDSNEYSRDGSMCPELPLETTLHEGDDYRTGEGSSYGQPLLQGPLDLNSSRNKAYNCSLCPFTCRKQIELTNHVGIHPDEKPFHCPHCDYKGAKYHYLRNHLLTHGSQKVHECPEPGCEYKSYQRGAIKVHMRKHSSEKRFGCPHCTYRTHFKGNLKLHLRVHSGEKPYACTECDFKCTQSGSLKIHMRGHSGEKPYACSACDYRTKHKGNLVMHQRKHTGDRPFRCNQCSFSTAQKMALTKHNKTVHGIEPPQTNRDRYHHDRMYQSGSATPPVNNSIPERPLEVPQLAHMASEVPHLTQLENSSPNDVRTPIFLPLQAKTEPINFHDFPEKHDFSDGKHDYPPEKQMDNPLKT